MAKTETATYVGLDGKEFTVKYDPEAPCWCCGEPVVAASMGGTVICSWCDCGKHRDGTPWTLADAMKAGERYRRCRAEAANALGLDDLPCVS